MPPQGNISSSTQPTYFPNDEIPNSCVPPMYPQQPCLGTPGINALGGASATAMGMSDLPPSMAQQHMVIANPFHCNAKLEEFGFEPIPDNVWYTSGQHSTLHFRYHIRHDVRKEITKYEELSGDGEIHQVLLKYVQRIRGPVPKWDTKASTFTNWQVEIVTYYRDRRVMPQHVAVQLAMQEGLSRLTNNTWIGSKKRLSKSYLPF